MLLGLLRNVIKYVFDNAFGVDDQSKREGASRNGNLQKRTQRIKDYHFINQTTIDVQKSQYL